MEIVVALAVYGEDGDLWAKVWIHSCMGQSWSFF